MGMFTSTQTQTQNQSSTSNPWSAQAPYLQQGFEQAAKNLNSSMGAQRPEGYVAQYSPAMYQAFAQMMGTGMQPGATATGTDAANRLNTSGAQALEGGLSGLANWQPGTTSQGVMNDANMFANNPAISGMVDASMRDSVRNASENVLPALARREAGTGNLNSSRGDIARGIVQRGLADQAGDLSSAFRNNAFNQGLSTATSIGQGRDQGALSALMGRISGGTGAVGTGTGAGVGAVNQQGGLYDIARGGISGTLAGNQARFDNQMGASAWDANALNNYWNTIGDKNWGGTTNSTGTTTQKSDPSTMAQIGSVASMIGSFWK